MTDVTSTLQYYQLSPSGGSGLVAPFGGDLIALAVDGAAPPAAGFADKGEGAFALAPPPRSPFCSRLWKNSCSTSCWLLPPVAEIAPGEAGLLTGLAAVKLTLADRL